MFRTPRPPSFEELFFTEAQGRTVDACPQFFCGYGYMTTVYPIARLVAYACVTRICAGTNQVMKAIVSKSMELKRRT